MAGAEPSMQAFLEWAEDMLDNFNAAPFLTGACWEGGDLTLTLEILRGPYVAANLPPSKWRVTAHGCTEHRVQLGPPEARPRLAPHSPRLAVANMPTRTLTFSAAPPEPKQVLADLRAVYDEAQWGKFGRYGLGGDLSFGAGVFAEGPEPLLRLYRPVLAAHEMRPAWLGKARPPENAPRECLALGCGEVWQDDAYVLADRFTAQRLEGEDDLR